MAEDEHKTGWPARWREKRRRKRERTGDTPQKQAEGRRRPAEPTVKDAADKVGLGGFISGSI